VINLGIQDELSEFYGDFKKNGVIKDTYNPKTIIEMDFFLLCPVRMEVDDLKSIGVYIGGPRPFISYFIDLICHYEYDNSKGEVVGNIIKKNARVALDGISRRDGIANSASGNDIENIIVLVDGEHQYRLKRNAVSNMIEIAESDIHVEKINPDYHFMTRYLEFEFANDHYNPSVGWEFKAGDKGFIVSKSSKDNVLVLTKKGMIWIDKDSMDGDIRVSDWFFPRYEWVEVEGIKEESPGYKNEWMTGDRHGLKTSKIFKVLNFNMMSEYSPVFFDKLYMNGTYGLGKNPQDIQETFLMSKGFNSFGYRTGNITRLRKITGSIDNSEVDGSNIILMFDDDTELLVGAGRTLTVNFWDGEIISCRCGFNVVAFFDGEGMTMNNITYPYKIYIGMKFKDGKKLRSIICSDYDAIRRPDLITVFDKYMNPRELRIEDFDDFTVTAKSGQVESYEVTKNGRVKNTKPFYGILGKRQDCPDMDSLPINANLRKRLTKRNGLAAMADAKNIVVSEMVLGGIDDKDYLKKTFDIKAETAEIYVTGENNLFIKRMVITGFDINLNPLGCKMVLDKLEA